MAGPREQPWGDPGKSDREPVFAGRFYPAEQEECRRAAKLFVEAEPATASETGILIGGIVPHAGWVYSGAIAGQTIGALVQGSAPDQAPDLVVVFGAVHTALPIEAAALDEHRRWITPAGLSAVDEQLRARLSEARDLFVVDERFHQREHAIEVELPLIQAAWPEASVLPVEVPANSAAASVGRTVARNVIGAGLRTVYLASSDLTHYGPAFGFVPAGMGPAALEWAKENDRRLLDRVVQMQVEAIVPEALARRNACGSGAIAAMLSACREHGGRQGKILRHASSQQTVASETPGSDAVGYASVVISR